MTEAPDSGTHFVSGEVSRCERDASSVDANALSLVADLQAKYEATEAARIEANQRVEFFAIREAESRRDAVAARSEVSRLTKALAKEQDRARSCVQQGLAGVSDDDLVDEFARRFSTILRLTMPGVQSTNNFSAFVSLAKELSK